MKRRETSEEEKALFREATRETPILPGKTKSAASATAEPAPPKKLASPPKNASTARSLDGRTAERLRRGQLEPEARLDLHGMTEAVAHRALTRFVRASHAGGCRLVLIVTGKGSDRRDPHAPFDLELDSRARGVLKSLAPRWLAEPALAALIAHFETAHRRHGGSGALYVYLRKAR